MNLFGSGRIGKWIAALLLLAPAALRTQALYAGSPEPDPAVTTQNSPSGFSLGGHNLFFGGHAGMNFPNAASDLFDMVTRELTLERKDFRSPFFGFDFGISLKSHYALVFTWEFSTVNQASEFRHYVEDNGNSIVQTTGFRQMPVIATFRYYPWKTGEEVGSYAWIPSRFIPYIAGGGGIMHYRFQQKGSFVDSNTLDIFYANLTSKGFTPVAHLAGGFDISLTPRLFANFEGRYMFANAHLSEAFTSFKPIDLKGLKTSGGLYIRF